MSKVRNMTFGKYKGKPILWVIATHIGYIMWSFENISWFKLNEEEQMFYDWEAIAIKKYRMPMTFPVEKLYQYVKDREALAKLETPYVDKYGLSFLPKNNPIQDLLIEAGVILGDAQEAIAKKKKETSIPFISSIDVTNLFAPTISKELDNMSDEEIEEMDRMGITLPFLHDEI